MAAGAVALAVGLSLARAEPAPPKEYALSEYQTSHFHLHSDVSPDEAKAALEQLETALCFCEQNWKRPLRGTITCYLANDVQRWPVDSLPHPLARVWIGGVGGATILEEATRSRKAQATIYASNQDGVLSHEVVHAYCCQTFGSAGPDWYKEGMAELVCYSLNHDRRLNCPERLLTILRSQPAKSIREIVEAGSFTGATQNSLDDLLANRVNPEGPVLLKQWSGSESLQVENMFKSYAWSWSLCYFLQNNPNYAHRFRRLGERYLEKRQDSFRQLFGSDWQQLEFEYREFLAHIQPGYRVDLCAWDWNKSFQAIDHKTIVNRRIHAARGYQPTGLFVEQGRTYQFAWEGTWQGVSEHEKASSDVGKKLIGVVFTDFELGRALDLECQGTFVAPESGRLYVRCGTEWNGLGENSGSVKLQLKKLN